MKLYINWILGIKSILSQLRECIMSLSESHGPRKTGGCLYLIAKDILKECLNVRETILQSVRHKEEIFLSNNSYSLGKLLRQQIRISPAFICNHLLATEEWGGISCFIASDPEFTGHNYINKKLCWKCFHLLTN